MRGLLFFLVSAFAVNTHALGPIPNGKYSGKMICLSHNQSYNSEAENVITVEDNSMTWETGSGKNKQSNKKDFTVDSLGFFDVKAPNGVGQGYFTENGMHFEITLDIGGLSVPGEDTIFYHHEKLFLISSATILEEQVKCEGVFSKLP